MSERNHSWLWGETMPFGKCIMELKNVSSCDIENDIYDTSIVGSLDGYSENPHLCDEQQCQNEMGIYYTSNQKKQILLRELLSHERSGVHGIFLLEYPSNVMKSSNFSNNVFFDGKVDVQILDCKRHMRKSYGYIDDVFFHVHILISTIQHIFENRTPLLSWLQMDKSCVSSDIEDRPYQFSSHSQIDQSRFVSYNDYVMGSLNNFPNGGVVI